MTDEHVREGTTLANAIAQVHGVTRLYPAGTLIGRVAGGDDVAVSADGIRIRIGVAADESAAEVCRRVYDVTRKWAQLHSPSHTIEVTVASIDGADPGPLV